MVQFDRRDLEEALITLGELVEARGHSFELAVIGGGSLLLQGELTRTTEDLDVLARIDRGGYVTAEPLPEPLRDAVREVAGLYALGEQWLNAGPTDLLRYGLPRDFQGRCETRRYGGLTLHLAGRLDQIAFKLYAAVDHSPRSKHFTDLQELAPTREELLFAASWAVTHDTSDDFKDQLDQVLEVLGVDLEDVT